MISPDDLRQAPILLVDDDPILVRSLQRALSQEGYTSVSAVSNPNDVAGLYLLLQPALLVLDLQMEPKDGFTIMEELRSLEQDAYPSMMVVSGMDSREARLRALELGARDFVTKPYDPPELFSRIRNLVEVRLLHDALRAQNTRLEATVADRTRELTDTQHELLERLQHVVEFRDNETGMHVLRMGRYAALLGRGLGLPAAECQLLEHACPLHDVGKIGIPDSILLKPGKLTADEWAIMKTHVTIGARLLAGSRSTLVRMAHDIALTHHERWDGSGYPHGLKGEEIPLSGRIAAICDVFDALTSERPYKMAWPVETAAEEIAQAAGSHFDPKLVAVFMQRFKEMAGIRLRYADEPGALPGVLRLAQPLLAVG